MTTLPALGPRGEGWVIGQFILIPIAVCVAFLAPGSWPSWIPVAGVALAGLGAVGGVWTWRALGRALTPFPKPVAGAGVVSSGPYRIVRHPMYSSGLLLLAGVCLLGSPWALLPVAALALWWSAKARVEERFLASHYPDYAEYTRRVRWRIVPGIT